MSLALFHGVLYRCTEYLRPTIACICTSYCVHNSVCVCVHVCTCILCCIVYYMHNVFPVGACGMCLYACVFVYTGMLCVCIYVCTLCVCMFVRTI